MVSESGWKNGKAFGGVLDRACIMMGDVLAETGFLEGY